MKYTAWGPGGKGVVYQDEPFDPNQLMTDQHSKARERGHRIITDNRDELERMYRDGASFREMGERLGVNLSSCRLALVRWGIHQPESKRRLPPASEAEISESSQTGSGASASGPFVGEG